MDYFNVVILEVDRLGFEKERVLALKVGTINDIILEGTVMATSQLMLWSHLVINVSILLSLYDERDVLGKEK